VRAQLWQRWRRFTPLTAGVVTIALLGLNVTKALPTGVAMYGLCLFALGLALYTQPTPESDAGPALAVQEQVA
jgi:hypothetical protein